MADFLTPTQFAKTQTGKSGATYGSYKTWVTKTRAQRAIAAKAPTGGGHPADPNSLNAQAFAMVNPALQASLRAISDQINRSTALGSNAIKGYGQSYLNQLPAIQKNVDSIYKDANAQQQGIAGSLAQYVQGQAQGAAAQMGQANFQGHGTGGGVAALAPVVAGAPAAASAYGGAISSGLNQQGAAERAYTAQLPAFGAAGIQQGLGQYMAGQQKQLADANATAQAQLPSMLQTAENTIYQRQQDAQAAQFQQQQFAWQKQQAVIAQQEQAHQDALSQQNADRDYQLRLKAANASVAASKAKSGTPVTAQDWDTVLGSQTQDLVGHFGPLATRHIPAGSITAVAGIPRKEMRTKITAYFRSVYGSKIPPALLKDHVDNIMLQIYNAPAPRAGGKGTGLQPTPVGPTQPGATVPVPGPWWSSGINPSLPGIPSIPQINLGGWLSGMGDWRVPSFPKIPFFGG
jgi:hypothetical protein